MWWTVDRDRLELLGSDGRGENEFHLDYITGPTWRRSQAKSGACSEKITKQ